MVIAIETLPDLPQAARSAVVAMEVVILTVFAVDIRAAADLWFGPSDALCAEFLGDSSISSPWCLRSCSSFPGFHHVRTLRLLRLLRILKLFKANRALDRIRHGDRQGQGRVPDLLSSSPASRSYLAAVGIYHFEHIVQPEAFGSIPASL